MPKKKVVEETTVEASEEVSESKGMSYNVFDKNGAFVRAYTTEDHGEKAGQLAKQFAEKINGEVK